MLNKELEECYLDTIYIAYTDVGEIHIRIGEHNQVLNDLLAKRGVSNWCFMTAWNPYSKIAEAGANKIQNNQLKTELNGKYVFYDGHGKGRKAEWPAEESFLVLGISPTESITLAKKYQQNAIVVGDLKNPAALLITV